MSDFTNTVDVVGKDELLASIIDKTITELADDRIITLGNRAIYQCLALTSVDLPNLTSIGDSCFSYCSALTTVIIRTGSVCTLATDCFESTPIASGTGYIYVPAALAETYKTTTNWVTYADQIRAIEDYPEEIKKILFLKKGLTLKVIYDIILNV